VQFLEWYYIIFWIPLAFGLVLIGATALGLGADSDLDADVDMDVDADFDMDVDAADIDGDGDFDLETQWWAHALSFLGVGKVPIIMLLMIMTMLFGGLGMALSLALQDVLGELLPLITVPTTMVITILLSGTIARIFHRYMPSTETYVTTKRDLIQKVGKLVIKASGNSGIVQVTDSKGSVHRVQCKTTGEILPGGSEVLLVEHDKENKKYIVAALAGQKRRL
jgi:membrane protein implicated in regulation of membrane protease activity